VAQSTVSSSVRALEREFGVPLFIRNTRSVELTAAGEALLPEARRTLAAAEAARATLRGVLGLGGGTVSIGTGKALGAGITDGLVAFSAAHPAIHVVLRQGGSMELLDAVADGRLDFAPLGLVSTPPDRLRDRVLVVPTHDEPMVFACARGHALIGRQRVRLQEIAGERFADFRPDWAIRIVNDEAFAALGFRREISFEMNDVDALLELVGRGLAVAVIPTSAQRRTPRVRYMELRPPAPRWRTGVAVPKGRPPTAAARALFDALLPGVGWPA
jgi:DNA-binding transcriptional LysR family regulator